MCNKTIDSFLQTLNFVSDWFVTNKMITKLYFTIFANDNIVCVNDDYGNVTFFSHKRDIFSVDFNSTRLGDFNFA